MKRFCQRISHLLIDGEKKIMKQDTWPKAAQEKCKFTLDFSLTVHYNFFSVGIRDRNILKVNFICLLTEW